MTNDEPNYTTRICIVVIVFCLSFGITEAVILADSSGSTTGCVFDIWRIVVAICVVNFLIAASMLIACISKIKNITLYASIASICIYVLVSIAIIVVIIRIDKSCINTSSSLLEIFYAELIIRAIMVAVTGASFSMSICI